VLMRVRWEVWEMHNPPVVQWCRKHAIRYRHWVS